MKKYTILELFWEQRVTRVVFSSWGDCNGLLYVPLIWIVSLVPSLSSAEDLDLRFANVGDETWEPFGCRKKLHVMISFQKKPFTLRFFSQRWRNPQSYFWKIILGKNTESFF